MISAGKWVISLLRRIIQCILTSLIGEELLTLPLSRRYEPPFTSISWPTTMISMMNTSNRTRMQQMATASMAACSPSLATPRAAHDRTSASVVATTHVLVTQPFTLQLMHFFMNMFSPFYLPFKIFIILFSIY